MMDLKGRKVVVVGLGKTGYSTARFLLKKGSQVVITDTKSFIDLGEKAKDLLSLGARIEADGHRGDIFKWAELIIPSPGVASDLALLSEARDRGVQVLSEIELAFQHISAPVIAITGTNGKSTTVALLAEIFNASKKRVFVGGNIGTPFIEMSGSAQRFDYALLEISSYQLEWIEKFRPFVAAILNITDDHLDRYPDFKSYLNAKKKIFMNQKKSDYAILNADDPSIRDVRKDVKSHLFYFSLKEKLRRGAYLSGNKIKYVVGEIANEMDIGGLKLRGRHNLENIMAAVITAQICGCEEKPILETVKNFKGLPHRQEFVKDVRGVKFYDDSKATNVMSAVRSIESFEEQIVLIAGGRDKGGDYSPLQKSMKGRVRAVILLGEARDKMAAALQGAAEIHLAKSMDEAIKLAMQIARAGDAVILSPGCSSFDMFSGYEDRGEVFADIVRKLE